MIMLIYDIMYDLLSPKKEIVNEVTSPYLFCIDPESKSLSHNRILMYCVSLIYSLIILFGISGLDIELVKYVNNLTTINEARCVKR